MQVGSVLFGSGLPCASSVEQPAHFADTRLDLFEDAVAHRGGQDLRAVVRHPLADATSVTFRQELFRDFELPEVVAACRYFVGAIGELRRRLRLVHGMQQPAQQHRWFLDVADEYVRAVSGFAHALSGADPRSTALCRLCDDLRSHLRSEGLLAMIDDLGNVRTSFTTIGYDLVITDKEVHAFAAGDSTPRADDGFVGRILSTFERFGPTESWQPPVSVVPSAGLSDLEAEILERVAALHPGEFAAAAAFYDRHRDLLGCVPGRGAANLDRELRFCLAVHEFCADLHAAGMPTCLPAIASSGSGIEMLDCYAMDLALDPEVRDVGGRCVTNDVVLAPHERTVVVTGPNRSGKTTLVRALGQIAYLTTLGCPVPARVATAPLPDAVFTVFAREERGELPGGRLYAELAELRLVLDGATDSSVVIVNEIFASTTVDDGVALGRRVMADLGARGALAVWVTFLDELTRTGSGTVSLVGQVESGAPDTRMHRFVREPADGQAYARALARQHGLSREQITATVMSRSGAEGRTR